METQRRGGNNGQIPRKERTQKQLSGVACILAHDWLPNIIFLIIITCARDTKTIKTILLNDFLKYLVIVFCVRNMCHDSD